MKILLTFLTCITGLPVFSVEAAERTISVLAIWTVIPGRAVFPLFHDLLIGLLILAHRQLCILGIFGYKNLSRFNRLPEIRQNTRDPALIFSGNITVNTV